MHQSPNPHWNTFNLENKNPLKVNQWVFSDNFRQEATVEKKNINTSYFVIAFQENLILFSQGLTLIIFLLKIL